MVLDEAYFEYVEDPDYASGLEFLDRFENMIVLRTFSKIHGLAGIRIGYGIATEEIITNLTESALLLIQASWPRLQQLPH